jgi:hypothetical protein
VEHNFLSILGIALLSHATRGHHVPVANLRVSDKLPSAIVRSLLPSSVLSLLPLLRCLLLSVWHFFNAESSTRLVVAVRCSFYVLSGVNGTCVAVNSVDESVSDTLVSWAQESFINLEF